MVQFRWAVLLWDLLLTIDLIRGSSHFTADAYEEYRTPDSQQPERAARHDSVSIFEALTDLNKVEAV